MPLSENAAAGETLTYSAPARFLHWSVAALVIAALPLGFIIADRYETNVPDGPGKAQFEATTELLSSSHKLIGLIILALMVLRLGYRLINGAPRPEPTLAGWEKGLSHAVHWALYLLLIVVPIGGYLGISYGDYLTIFGVKIPGLIALHDGDNHDKISEMIFKYHGIGATVIMWLAGFHIVAALYHRLVKKDAVVARMAPGRQTA